MDEKKVGVSAQEVLKVLPEAVTNAPIDPQYHTVQYEWSQPKVLQIKYNNTQVSNLKVPREKNESKRFFTNFSIFKIPTVRSMNLSIE